VRWTRTTWFAAERAVQRASYLQAAVRLELPRRCEVGQGSSYPFVELHHLISLGDPEEAAREGLN
jgi:hypothetical protein